MVQCPKKILLFFFGRGREFLGYKPGEKTPAAHTWKVIVMECKIKQNNKNVLSVDPAHLLWALSAIYHCDTELLFGFK